MKRLMVVLVLIFGLFAPAAALAQPSWMLTQGAAGVCRHPDNE